MVEPSSLQNQVCLVTGATAGLGKAAAVQLAQRGATVVIVARTQAKGDAAVAEIKAKTDSAAVSALTGDLSSLAAVRRVAAQFREQHDRLHVLINNAAVFKQQRILTGEGLELMFATNHLAPFLLTNLLLDMLQAGTPSTIITVSAPSTSKLSFDDLQGVRSFSALNAFGASKAANLLFTCALARRLAGKRVTANAYHPGIVRTSLMREAPAPMRLLLSLFSFMAQPPEKAAEGLVWLAETQAGGANGQLFRGQKPMATSDYVRDEAVQEHLWAESARLAGSGEEDAG
ncbi:MAG: SDR family NAD(P)-dependent oxidoreductase [Anaerolineae bacterium]|nr:SDR family NAD(P)-dependent oxidoreductase [Anaerolineae bacterium]